jgi:hypothetical protein
VRTKTVDIVATVKVPEHWTSFDIKAELQAVVNDITEDTELIICEVSAIAPIADIKRLVDA